MQSPGPEQDTADSTRSSAGLLVGRLALAGTAKGSARQPRPLYCPA